MLDRTRLACVVLAASSALVGASVAGCEQPAKPAAQAPLPAGYQDQPAGKVMKFARSSESLKVDLVGAGDGALKPDGAPDGAFTATVYGPLDALVLIATDAAGVATEGGQWDTFVGDQPLPADIRSRATHGGSTLGLGVAEKGALLNKPDGSLPTIGAGPHELTLYAKDAGSFKPGSHFALLAMSAEGIVFQGPVAAY